MLSKQAWRIVADPDSLIACIYKARYFPDCSFWEASPHSAPSYSWRSIFSTRDVLNENVYWQVGDDSNVSIFQDKWLPGSVSGTPSFLFSDNHEVVMVKDLMEEVGSWSTSIVQRLFSPSDAALILQTPLSRRLVPDRLCWKLAKDGIFSVMTMYWCAVFYSSNYAPIESKVGVSFWNTTK